MDTHAHIQFPVGRTMIFRGKWRVVGGVLRVEVGIVARRLVRKKAEGPVEE